MPLLGVFDNPKTIVTDRDGDKVKWQDTFAWFAVECGFSPHVTWPNRPQEKGGVENLVGFAKSSFFKAHQFRDRADLEKRLEQWHVYVNEERPSRATKKIPREAMMLEAERLRPLQIDPSGFTLRYGRKVRTDGFIELHGTRYFAGFAYVGRVVTVRLGETEVTILPEASGDKALVHPRVPLNREYSVLPFQREELLVKEGARPYVKRQLLMDGCPAAEWFMTELRHRRPAQWEEEVDTIFRLLELHGEQAVRDAIIRSGTSRDSWAPSTSWRSSRARRPRRWSREPRARNGPRCRAEATTPADDSAAVQQDVRRSRAARLDAPGSAGAARERRDRASHGDAHHALDEEGEVPVPQDDRGVRLRVPGLVAAPHARPLPSAQSLSRKAARSCCSVLLGEARRISRLPSRTRRSRTATTLGS